MLFGSHKHLNTMCGFCKMEIMGGNLQLFGFNSTGPNVAICSKCVLDSVSKAIFNETTKGNDEAFKTCDFCSKSSPDILKIYTKGGLGVCEKCISYFVEISLTIEKQEGAECF